MQAANPSPKNHQKSSKFRIRHLYLAVILSTFCAPKNRDFYSVVRFCPHPQKRYSRCKSAIFGVRVCVRGLHTRVEGSAGSRWGPHPHPTHTHRDLPSYEMRMLREVGGGWGPPSSSDGSGESGWLWRVRILLARAAVLLRVPIPLASEEGRFRPKIPLADGEASRDPSNAEHTGAAASKRGSERRPKSPRTANI